MKKIKLIVLLGFLLLSTQGMARWRVTYLSPSNLDHPSKSFNVQIETNDSIICFTVKISAKEKQPFPAKSGTLLRVSKYIPGHGTEQIAICPIMYEEEEDLRIFRFDVSTNYLANSTFSYSEPYEGKMSRFGGHMYAFQLDDFMKEKTLPNKNEIRTSNKSLQNTFKVDIVNYLKAFNEKDWDGVIEKIYPKLFDLVNKEQMIDTFKSFETMGLYMTVQFTNIDNITPIVYFENLEYCRVYYNGIAKLKINSASLKNKNQLYKNLVSTYGTNNIKFDKENNTFILNITKSMIAISEKGTNSWKYIEYNEQNNKVFLKLIPEEVLIQLKL